MMNPEWDKHRNNAGECRTHHQAPPAHFWFREVDSQHSCFPGRPSPHAALYGGCFRSHWPGLSIPAVGLPSQRGCHSTSSGLRAGLLHPWTLLLPNLGIWFKSGFPTLTSHLVFQSGQSVVRSPPSMPWCNHPLTFEWSWHPLSRLDPRAYI